MFLICNVFFKEFEYRWQEGNWSVVIWGSSTAPPLNKGTTLATFSNSGNLPREIQLLMRAVNGYIRNSLHSFIIGPHTINTSGLVCV